MNDAKIEVSLAALGNRITEDKEHRTIIRELEDRLRASDEKFQVERDRRYTEVKNAEEKALKIKEEADKTALGLDREIRAYKDEKANQLREQIGGERGLYVTKTDLAVNVEKIEALISPLSDYVKTRQGEATGSDKSWTFTQSIIAIALGVSGLMFSVALGIAGLYLAIGKSSSTTSPQVIYAPAPSVTSSPKTK